MDSTTPLYRFVRTRDDLAKACNVEVTFSRDNDSDGKWTWETERTRPLGGLLVHVDKQPHSVTPVTPRIATSGPYA